MKTAMERQCESRKNEKLSDYTRKVRQVVPDLRNYPYVPIPFKCKLRFHRNVCLGKVPDSHHRIWICVRCGRVEAGWGYVSMTGGGDFYDYMGYANPNKLRTLDDKTVTGGMK